MWTNAKVWDVLDEVSWPEENTEGESSVDSWSQVASQEQSRCVKATAPTNCKKSNTNSYKKSKTTKSINHTVSRKSKTDEQLKYLNKLFKELNGNWDVKVKYEAMKATGLKRKQIYKWFYEMNRSSTGKKIVQKIDDDSYNHENDLSSSDLESSSGSAIKPIF